MPISDKLKASVEQNVNRQNFQTEKIAHRPRPFNAPLEVQDVTACFDEKMNLAKYFNFSAKLGYEI